MAKPHDLTYLPASFELEQEILDQLSSRPGSQRCVVGRDELLLITQDVPKSGNPERDAVAFWRRHDGLWVDTQGGRGLRRLAELIERFAAEIKAIETAIDTVATAAEAFGLARASGPLARATRNLAVAVEQALAQDEDSKELRALRDRVREVERAAETVYQDTRLALEFRQAERIEKQNSASEGLTKTVFQLNVLAGFFLPVITLCGLFLLYFHSKLTFWLAGPCGLAIGAGVVFMLLKNSGKSWK
ncbi:MAG: CorA-like Mg2+ transporter protein [Akkermansiaceae bacterium]|nr:CorA-like Mg2+ transporter protein [Akkermansiaceae bacterium]